MAGKFSYVEGTAIILSCKGVLSEHDYAYVRRYRREALAG